MSVLSMLFYVLEKNKTKNKKTKENKQKTNKQNY